MIQLKPFTEQDFPLFKSWILSKEELFQFAGPIFTFPLVDENLLSYLNDKRRVAYKVCFTDTGAIIGHCELNHENTIPRLSRILLADKSLRGKGIGVEIVNKMLEKLFIENDFIKADLNVFDWNIAAIKCYEKVGFNINHDIFSIQGDWKAINMSISKEDWIK